MKLVTEAKLDKYFDVTGRALKKVKIAPKEEFDWKEKAEDFLDMAQRYYDDAKWFKEKDDFINAFAALNYAHG